MKTKEEILKRRRELNLRWDDVNENTSWSDGKTKKLDEIDAQIETINWILKY